MHNFKATFKLSPAIVINKICGPNLYFSSLYLKHLSIKMLTCNFIYDDNVTITLPDHYLSNKFYNHINTCSEITLRKICTYLIKNGIIDRNKNIIDAGAWIGDNAIPWAKNIKGIVYAIDPSTENCLFIQAVIARNNINNIKIMRCAISEKNEQLSTNDDINHCSFVMPENTTGATKVQAYSIDYLYECKEIDNIGFIHLDVESMEFSVIKGSVNVIKRFKPIITFEQHVDINDCDGLIKFMKNLDYNIYLINESYEWCRYDCRNFIAFPDEISNDIITLLICDLNIQDIFLKI